MLIKIKNINGYLHTLEIESVEVQHTYFNFNVTKYFKEVEDGFEIFLYSDKEIITKKRGSKSIMYVRMFPEELLISIKNKEVFITV